MALRWHWIRENFEGWGMDGSNPGLKPKKSLCVGLRSASDCGGMSNCG